MSFSNYAYADSIDSQVKYYPTNETNDPWQGGKIVFDDNVSVKGDEITYNPIFSQTVNFQMVWEMPKSQNANQWLDALTNNSYLNLGDQRIYLTKDNLTIDKGNLVYIMDTKSFDLFALLKWLANIIFGSSNVEIKFHLEFDVNKLTTNKDKTPFMNLLTTGKLPPSENKQLLFHSNFYNRLDELKLQQNASLATWANYISPWNEEQANSEVNGKQDDTQNNDQTEVSGVQRVLKGDNYKNRIVELPITKTINPTDYMRSVNLFSRQPLLGASSGITASSPPQVTDTFSDDENGVRHLERKTSYSFGGHDVDQVAFSPVPITFVQKTAMKFSLDKTEISTTSAAELTGELQTEGKENQIYYQINGGERKKLTTYERSQKNLKLQLPSLPEGSYSITLEAENEYGLKQQQTVHVNVVKPELKLAAVTNTFDFGENDIPTPGQKLYNKQPFSVQVLDTFPSAGDWKIAAMVEAPLATDSGEKLPADIYINDSTGKSVQITSDLAPLYQNEAINQGNIEPISFNSGEGIYLQMKSANVKTNQTYHGSIKFVLQSAP